MAAHASLEARGGSRPALGELPAPLGRRVEAALFDWDGTAVPDRRADASELRRVIERLSRAGFEREVRPESGSRMPAREDGSPR